MRPFLLLLTGLLTSGCSGLPAHVAAGAETKNEAASRAVPPEAYVLFCEGVGLEFQGKYAEAIQTLEKALAFDPRSAAILSEIGTCYHRMAKNNEAADYLKRSLEMNPGSGTAHATLALVYAAMGRRGDMLAELEAAARAPERTRDHESLIRRIAWLYERQGDYKKAAEWYRFLLESGYRRRDTYLSLGTLQLKQRLFDDAIVSLRQVVQRTPSDDAAATDIAEAYADLSEKDRNDAIRPLEAAAAKAADPATHEVLAMAYKAAGRREDMLRELEAAARAISSRAAAQRLFLAEYYEQLGEPAKAIEWRRQILEGQRHPTAEALTRLATLYAKNEQMEEAAAIYRKAMEADPQRRELLRRIADCHSALYQWDKAAAILEEYLKGRTPEAADAEAIYELGELYEQAGKTQRAADRKKEAFEVLTRLVGKPDSKVSATQLHLLLAQLYYADDKPDKALEYLLIAQKLEPDDTKKLLLMASAYKRVQKWNEAAATFRQYLEKDRKSLPAAGSLLEISQCQEAVGDFTAAAASRQEAEKVLLDAYRATDDDATKSVIQAQLGEMALSRNRPAAAIEHFLEALRLQPKHSRIHLFLAQCYQLLGDWQRAAAYYQSYLTAIEPDEEDARHIYRLGLAQVRAGQTEAGRKNKARAIQLLTSALDELEKQKRGTPAHKAQILRELAGLYASEKRYDQAIAAIQRAIASAPAGKRADYQLALASFYGDLKRHADGEKVLLEAYTKEPDDPAVLNHLGYFYAERGKNLDQAVELVRKALRQEPLNGAYLDSLAWAYFKQGKFQDALQLLLRAVDYDEDAVIRDHLGDAYLKLGKVKEAREAWLRATALDPDIEGVREKLKQTEQPPAPQPQPQPAPPGKAEPPKEKVDPQKKGENP